MPALVTKEAPEFTADAVVNEEFHTVKLSDYRGKYVVLFFYPLDFTFVCPTEIIAYSDKIDEFRKRGAEVLGASVDSKFSHLAWIRTPRPDGGLGGLRFPLVSDITKKISADYGVLLDGGVALRGTFLIDCFAVHPGPLFDALGGRPVVAHNAAFDLQFLRALGFEPGEVQDTMLMSQVLYAGECVQPLLAASGQAWDAIVVVRYPNRAAYARLLEDPAFAAIADKRKAALREAMLLPMDDWPGR